MEDFKIFVIQVVIFIVIAVLIIILYIAGINALTNAFRSESQKNIKEYMDKGYERSIVMIDTNNKMTEILIKKDSELLNAIKKELLKKEK